MQKKWFIGIDLSKKTLDMAIHVLDKQKKCFDTYGHFKNDQRGYGEFLLWLKSQRIGLKQVVICMEHTGIYCFELCVFLESKGIDYSLLSPVHLSRSLGLKRSKSDKVDAYFLAFYGYLHRDNLVLSKLAKRSILRLKELMAEHRRYVKEAAVRKAYLREKRETHASYERAKQDVVYLQRRLKEVEEEMQQIIGSDTALKRSYRLLTSIKGIGRVNAVNTIVCTHNFEHFDTARKYACYIGIAPFEHSSGTSIRGKTRVSKMGASDLKADLSQAAKSAVEWDKELKAYYKRKMAEGKAYGRVMNAVKFKLVGRMFAVIKRGTPWVEMQTYRN